MSSTASFDGFLSPTAPAAVAAAAAGASSDFGARQARKAVPAARKKKENLGSPGIAASASITPAAIISGRRRDKTCCPTSTERVEAEEARVTTMPPAIDTSKDGIMVTRPSPTVKTV